MSHNQNSRRRRQAICQREIIETCEIIEALRPGEFDNSELVLLGKRIGRLLKQCPQAPEWGRAALSLIVAGKRIVEANGGEKTHIDGTLLGMSTILLGLDPKGPVDIPKGYDYGGFL